MICLLILVILFLILLILAIALPLIYYVHRDAQGTEIRRPEPPISEWSPQAVTFKWEPIEYIDWFSDYVDVKEEERTKISGYDLLIKTKDGNFVSEVAFC